MILASASPRRRELLESAGIRLQVEVADIDESRLEGEAPVALVERLARQKAAAVYDKRGGLAPGEDLLAADTVVWIGNDVLGKPHDEADACAMLARLSGNTHHVSTGVRLMRGIADAEPSVLSFVDTAEVTFRELDPAEIRAYVDSGEPMDKAGAYGIQGGAGAFVARLVGDFDTVVGLPVRRVLAALEEQ